MQERRKVGLILGGVAGAAVVGVGGYLALERVAEREPEEPQFEPAPEFALKTLGARDVSLEDSAGSPRIVTAFASWSPYSEAELQMLDRLAREHPDITVIAINRKEPKPVARDYVARTLPEDHALTILEDPEDSWFADAGGYHMPETLFIDGEGNIRHHQRGPMSEGIARRELGELLAGE